MTFNPCLLIPVYNHPNGIRHTIAKVAEFNLSCILINDGSDDTCTAILRDITRQHPWVTLIESPTNNGKGAAVKMGFFKAAEMGFSHAVQIDADGQHCFADIPTIIELSHKHPHTLISGCPEYDGSIPKLRYYARYLTHFWVWVHTLSFSIQDSMCGFRAYPLAETVALLKKQATGNRMEFDTEIMVKLYWEGVKTKHFTTKVIYPIDGISHFLGVKDNVLITKNHTKLFFGMLLRLPTLLKRKFSNGN